MVRSIFFCVSYYAISVLYILLATLTLLLPGRKATGWVVGRYARRMVQAMRHVAGIKLEVRGQDQLPDGAFIIAAKHHSWFDGFCMMTQFSDLAFVTGDHLEKIPLLGGILTKLGAIVVNNCGGHKARAALAERAAEAHAAGRRILIYPEGHLSAVGEYHRYRTGVYHMYKNFNLPVVPAATNLGVFAPQQKFRKTQGTAILEFLEPIPLGLNKVEFMERLQRMIEDQSNALISEATGQPIQSSVQVQE